LFSKEPRCIYRKNSLADVVCQLRFPEILAIEAEIPAKFQESIRSVFPQYNLRKEPAPGGGHTKNHQFITTDSTYRINLTSKFISLSCSRYRCWEEFATRLDQPLAAFISIYNPGYFERVGLRYLNIISRNRLNLHTVPFRELIQPCYLGILSYEDISEETTARCTVDVDTALHSGCRMRLHAGPGKINLSVNPDPEVKFILDLDLYMGGNVPLNASAGALQTLHSQSYSIFRGAITDHLHDAMI